MLRQAIRQGCIVWRQHALERLAERDLPQRVVPDVLLSGEHIQQCADDKPFPSSLVLGYVVGKPLRVLVALDEANTVAFITANERSLEVFEPDYRTRRKS
jgi:hypothetical protein